MQRIGVPHSSGTVRSGGPGHSGHLIITGHSGYSILTHGAVVTQPLGQGLVDASPRHVQEADKY